MNLVRNVALVLLLACTVMLGACATGQAPKGQTLPLVSVGVASFTQPTGTLELLAGYIPENQGKADLKDLAALDVSFNNLLTQTARTYNFINTTGINPNLKARNQQNDNALAYWVEVGKANKVDLLIVPMVINWHERQGGGAGATDSAEVIVDFFLIDTRGEGRLVNRSHFEEKQASLSDNLLDVGTFFSRGGKWLSANELSQEAMEKAIREFGL